MSLKNKAMKAARILAGDTVSPEHHANLTGVIEREAQALSMAHGKHVTPAHVSDRFTKDELRAIPANVIPWARLQIEQAVVLLGLSHGDKDMMDPEGQVVRIDFKGADVPNAVILGYYENGASFPSDEEAMLLATDATPNRLMDKDGMLAVMKGGLLEMVTRMLAKQGMVG
jgi:hypothetical protein